MFDDIFAGAKKLNDQKEEVTAICRINRYEAYRLTDGSVTEMDQQVKRVEHMSSATQRIMLKTDTNPLIIDVPGSVRAKKMKASYFIGKSSNEEYLFIQSKIGTLCMYKLSTLNT